MKAAKETKAAIKMEIANAAAMVPEQVERLGQDLSIALVSAYIM